MINLGHSNSNSLKHAFQYVYILYSGYWNILTTIMSIVQSQKGDPIHTGHTCLCQKNVALPLFIKHKSGFEYDVHRGKNTKGEKA